MPATEDSILADLGEGDFGRYNTDFGYFESASLAVYYDFALPPESPAHASELRRTTAHETTHFYQATTTSYGFYIQTLRELQTAIVVRIIKSLRNDYKLAPKAPLARYILSLAPKQKYLGARRMLRLWLLAEWIALYFEGDFAKTVKMAEIPWFRGMPLRRAVAEVDSVLAHHHIDHGMLTDYAGGGFENNEKARSLERMFIMHRQFTPIGDVRSIIEGAATVAEWWGSRDIEKVRAAIADRMDPTYSAWFIDAISSHPDFSVKELILSLLALADLALNGAILPQQLSARSPEATVFDLHPAYRMLHGCFALGAVRPMQDLDDYSRFANEVSAHNGWAPLHEVLAAAYSDLRRADKSTNTRAWLFAQALHWRGRLPFSFLHPVMWETNPPDPRMAMYFLPPVIEYQDRTLVHKDRDFAFAYDADFVLAAYARALLLTSRRAVTVPHYISADDGSYLVSAVQATFRAADAPVPGFIVRSARRTALDH